MKIIDFHTHYYPDKIVEKALMQARSFITPVTDGTRNGLIKSMREFNISYSVGLPLVNNPANARGLNNWAMRENHDEVIMLGSVHPAQTDIAETLKFISEHNMHGIKLHPEYQNFWFDDEECDLIWESCIEHDLFVVTHCGFDVMFQAPYHCTPERVMHVHRRYPELKLIAAHGGGLRMTEDCFKYLIDLPVYFDLAFMSEANISIYDLEKLIKRHGADKILYGSDSPWASQFDLIDRISGLSLSDEEKSLIFHKNAEKLLKI